MPPHMNLKKTSYSTLLLVLALAGAVFAAGCGNASYRADATNGKTLFAEKCGACHTLARANTQGVAGPNLDGAFKQARYAGLGESTFAGVVEHQILYPMAQMPVNLVTGNDAKDVAAYVAMVAAKPGEDTGRLAQAGTPESGPPVEAKNGKLQIDAVESGATRFITDQASGPAGRLTLILDNPSPVPHNIAVRDNGVSGAGEVVNKGGTSQVSANFKPGKYTFYCSVPGHEAGGMKGTLEVK